MKKSNYMFFFNRKYQFFALLVDVGLISIIFLLQPFLDYQYSNYQLFIFSIIFLLFWIMLSYVSGRYHPQKFSNYYSFFKDLFKVPIIFLLINNSILLLSNFDNTFINGNEIINIRKIIIYIVFISIFRLINKLFFNRINQNSKSWIFLGSKETFENLTNELKNHSCPKIIKISKKDLHHVKIKDSIEGLVLEEEKNLTIENIDFLKLLEGEGFKILNLIDWLDIFLQRLPIKLFDNKSYFIKGRNFLKKSSNEMILKRVGDFSLSLFLFVLTLPIIVFSSLCIYLEDRGRVFYSQKRCGKNGKIFYITKLRTMYLNSEDNGAQWSKRNDPRITKIGSFLRKTRLDELPQLLSVMKGDMSLIGPRPERPEFDEKLIELIPFYRLRYELKPGLSGWAQVNFPYGASIHDAETKLSYDLYYLRNFSFWMDVLILFKTIRLVFNAKGSLPE